MGAIVGWIIFGLIAGAIAKLLMPGKDSGGMVVTMLLGIAGALVGGFIGRALWGSAGVNDWSVGSFALAIGAVSFDQGPEPPGSVHDRDRPSRQE
jgi:uncharacterized membrane protein YeaQ/YmgE (transglycosylase-associated protein family)